MSFGIDHPLIAVQDLAASAEQARRLGFRVHPRHEHPWGTDNHLLFFPRNFIELIGIGRPERLDYRDDNGFAFGRQIAERLALGEGIAMVALESEEMAHDHRTLVARGAEPPTPIIFRRLAHLPDGRDEEVGVALTIVHRPEAPLLTQFLCQQLRPELFRTAPTQDPHPNTAREINALWYVSAEPAREIDLLRRVHGELAVRRCEGGYCIETEKGNAYLLTPAAIEERFPLLRGLAPRPTRGVALSLACDSLATAQAHWSAQGITWQAISPEISDVAPDVLGGTLLRFEEHAGV